MRWIGLLLIVCCLVSPAWGERLVGGGNNWPPWTRGDEKTQPVGICVEVFKELCRRNGYEAAIQIYPKKRIDLMFDQGHIDAEIASAPNWRRYQKDAAVYTKPFYETERMVLMKAADAIAAGTPADFFGKRLGCNIGYYYPEGFEAEFKSGRVDRYNVREGPMLIKILDKGRMHGVIVERREAGYWMHELALSPDDFAVAYVFQTKIRLCIRLHARHQALVERFNRSIEKMRTQGAIQDIVDKYSDPKQIPSIGSQGK